MTAGQTLTPGERKVMRLLDELGGPLAMGTRTSHQFRTVHRKAAMALVARGDLVELPGDCVSIAHDAAAVEDAAIDAADEVREALHIELTDAGRAKVAAFIDAANPDTVDAERPEPETLEVDDGWDAPPPVAEVIVTADTSDFTDAMADVVGYDLGLAKAEVEQLMAWRKTGKHHGEARPDTPNRDAMLAAFAAGAVTVRPVKPKAAKATKAPGDAKRTPVKVEGRDYSRLGEAEVHFTYKGTRFVGNLTGDPRGRVRLGDGADYSLSSGYCKLTGSSAANGHVLWLTEDGTPAGQAASSAS